MSSETIKGCIAFTCDLPGCDDSIETGAKDFLLATAVARAEDWQFRKRETGWRHFCCRAHEEMDYRGQSLVRSKK